MVNGSLTRKVSPFSWQAGQTTVLVARRSSRIGVTLDMMPWISALLSCCGPSYGVEDANQGTVKLVPVLLFLAWLCPFTITCGGGQ